MTDSSEGNADRFAVSDELLRRYLAVSLLNRSPWNWSRQVAYPGKFPRLPFRMSDAFVAGMLARKFWLACVAPESGRTDRLVIDLDAKSEGAVTARNERYLAIRALFGSERVPLVYGTPSRFGIRLAYRIPRGPLLGVIGGFQEGLLPDAMRGAGLTLADGQIEVYPQVSRPDRLPLGRAMPLLDPESLQPLVDDATNDFSMESFRTALDLYEQWHRAPDDTLLDHLRSLPHAARPRAVIVPPAPGNAERATPAAVQDSSSRLVPEGLQEPGTRRAAEWLVGVEMLKEPARFGLSASPTDQQFAEALAHWLSEHHNGQSNDWNSQLRRFEGDLDATIAYFTDEYLRLDASGRTLPERIRQKLASSDPSYGRVLAVSQLEAEAVLGLAGRHFEPGTLRYRFECWLFGWLLDVKRIAMNDRKAGKNTSTFLTPPDGDPLRAVVVEIRSQRMRDVWPFGAGKNAEGQLRYVEFRQVLEREWIMRMRKPYRRKGYGGADRDYATRYVVREPNLSVRRRDLPYDATQLRQVVARLEVDGEAVTLAEAMHALHAASKFPKRAELVARYRRASADRIRALAGAVTAALVTAGTQ